MRANVLDFRFLLRRRVSITLQLQQCYGMPHRRGAATATATATASCTSMYVTPSGSHQKIYCSPNRKNKFTSYAYPSMDDSLCHYCRVT